MPRKRKYKQPKEKPTMAEMPNIDWNIFLNAAKTITDRFTEKELVEIHELALRLDQIMKAVASREPEHAHS